MRHKGWLLLIRICIGAGVMGLLHACGSANTKSDSEKANNQMQLGVRYLDMGRLAIAKEHLEKARAWDSDNAAIINAQAFLYEKLEQPEKARNYYTEALLMAPDNLSVLNNFGRFLCERGEYAKGMTYLEKAIASPLNDRKWMALSNAGRCALAQGLTDSAEAYFRQALQLQAFYAPALLEMQKISYQKADYWAAKGFLGRYLSVGKHTPETLWYAYQTERALGNRASAEEYREKLLETFPLSDEAKQIRSARKNLTNGK